ncbi:nudix hydrolase 2-like [Humulus lupulus]|uniref:nudix hydrolase 2-like n=1 Tax=Humulus lupulus TaxID=3486 RepID=UPI002B403124|nr:nudix hydrolase 2-like [Humulus lupulus]
MQRIRATKIFPYLLTNSKSFTTTASSRIIPPLPKRSFIGPFSTGICIYPKNKLSFLIQSKSASTNSLAFAKETMSEIQVELLNAAEDLHGGVRIELKEPMDSQEFSARLSASLSQWRLQDKKGVWIKLPIELSILVEVAVKEGFKYHHAEPDYLMLVKWIPETVDTLPANASHRLGIGAFVMNDNREVLVVQERNGKFKGSGLWKYPTGVVNEGEDICDAAIREVKEETGVDTEFVEVLAFRQSHKSFFNKSDMFFVCMLKPQSYEIQKQIVEIDDAKWMPVAEYAAQPFIRNHELFSLVSKICLAKTDTDYSGFCPQATTTASGKTTYLYFNHQYLDNILRSGISHSN